MASPCKECQRDGNCDRSAKSCAKMRRWLCGLWPIIWRQGVELKRRRRSHGRPRLVCLAARCPWAKWDGSLLRCTQPVCMHTDGKACTVNRNTNREISKAIHARERERRKAGGG